MNNVIENFFWHDGIINGCEFSINDSERNLDLKVSVYGSQNDPERKNYIVNFVKVSEFTISCDLDYLWDNVTAGNIVDANFIDGKFFMYLIEGYIKIKANDLNILEL